MQWTTLRPLQEKAIQTLLTTDKHLLLAAATASGKTEAAFLPILSRLAAKPMPSAQALYISPLKALINDQFERLERLCAETDIAVHRWHGDVDGEKKRRLRQKPGGVLLITPESLESNFINYGPHLSRIYQHLDYVVIDELHAFLDNVRGCHLQSLLSRLRTAAGVTPRMLGLSATLADFTAAKSFLAIDDAERVEVVEDKSSSRELKVGIKSFTNHQPNPDHPPSQNTSESEMVVKELTEDIAKHFKNHANLLFTNSRRTAEVLADGLKQIANRERWPTNPFYVHHGALSREIREDVESRLKSGEPISPFCTTTLEMGIDIGAVHSVGQIGPPWSVNSLVQRAGRSGRREGQPAILRLYAVDDLPGPGATITAQLYPELLQSVALVELMLEGWLEPVEHGAWNLSTCVHQVLSILRQTGGIKADLLFHQLCIQGPFRQVDKKHFLILIRGLALHQIVEQMASGELIIAPKGEKIVENKEFYAAFVGGDDYRIVHASAEIGKLPPQVIPPPGHHFILNGQRWKIEEIESTQRLVTVSPSKGAAPPTFIGDGGEIHDRIVQKMRDILASSQGYAYLHPSARESLERARDAYYRTGLDTRDLLPGKRDVEWFPWLGTRAINTIAAAARLAGLSLSARSISVMCRCPLAEFESFLKKLQRQEFSPLQIAQATSAKIRYKFDHLLPEELLDLSNADSRVDLQPITLAAERTLAQESAQSYQ